LIQLIILIHDVHNLFFTLDFTQGMILPKKDEEKKNGELTKPEAVKATGVKLPGSTSSPDIQKLSLGTKIETENYECHETFKCPPVELFNVLTQPELLRAFTNAEARVDTSVGGKFSLLGGHVTGEFTELVLILIFLPKLLFTKIFLLNVLIFCSSVPPRSLIRK